MSDFVIADMDRRIANLIRIGTIVSVNVTDSPPTAVVSFEDFQTQGLPFCVPRAGTNRNWNPPDIGEQVLVVSQSGEHNQAYIVGMIYQDLFPANGNSLDVERTTYKDGTVIEYDRAAHKLTVDASASNGQVIVNVGSGSVTTNCDTSIVNATTSATINSPLTHCTGKLTVDGLITGNGGIQVSGGTGRTASISGSMQVTGGELTVDGIGVKSHHHIEHDGPVTGVAQA